MIRNIFYKLRNAGRFLSSGQFLKSGTNSDITPNPTKNLEDGWSWVPKWHEIFAGQFDQWLQYVEAAKNGPKVLIAPCVGGNSTLTPIESLLAVALTLRGANVEILLCDKAIPACMTARSVDYGGAQAFVARGPDKCDWCFESGYGAFKELGLKVQLLSQWINESDRQEARRIADTVNLETAFAYNEDNIPIGEHAVATALRYFGRGDFENEPLALEVVKQYVEAGIICKRALAKLYQANKYQHTLVNHGLYVPQGIVTCMAKEQASTIATWGTAYRNKCIHIDSGDTFLRTVFQEKECLWRDVPWTDEMENDIVDYLRSRWKGVHDWVKVQNEAGLDDSTAIGKEIGIDYTKPTIGLLTNVVWDAQIHYPNNAFAGMLDWLIKTIRYFQKRPDLQLLIRIHPSELKGYVISRQLAFDEIKKVFPRLPANVFIIPPDSSINTYAAMMPCKGILIYGTTAGLEFASIGFPVVVAGEAWIRGKGFSIDVSSESEYFAVLDQFPPAESRLSADKIQLARKYAYHNYFRKMVPISVLQVENSFYVPYTIKHVGVEGFLPGRDSGLDVICDGILKGTPFVYPYEKERSLSSVSSGVNPGSASLALAEF